MPAVEPIDLQGLDAQTAREVVAGYLRSLKEVQRQLRAAAEQVRLWEGRANLASEAGEHDLARRAAGKAAEARAHLVTLAAEEQEVAAAAGRLKAELQRLRAAPALSGIDPDALLAELQSLTGEPDALADELAGLQVEHDLAELKRKLDAES